MRHSTLIIVMLSITFLTLSFIVFAYAPPWLIILVCIISLANIAIINFSIDKEREDKYLNNAIDNIEEKYNILSDIDNDIFSRHLINNALDECDELKSLVREYKNNCKRKKELWSAIEEKKHTILKINEEIIKRYDESRG